MIIIDRNITSLEAAFKAGQNVEGALSESACNDLLKRGWAHKSQAKTEADQDDAQNDEQTDDAQSNEGDNTESQEPALENSESEGDQSEEETNETEEPSDEPEETEEVVIDSLKELDQSLEQTTKPSGTSRKRGK
jgi:hypothetical protein